MLGLLVISALVVLQGQTANGVQKFCVNSDPAGRKVCGPAGITPDECIAKGCCFDNSVVGVKWCFQKTACDNGNPSDRVNCGRPGITESQCTKKRCCFDNSVSDVPFCFSL